MECADPTAWHAPWSPAHGTSSAIAVSVVTMSVRRIAAHIASEHGLLSAPFHPQSCSHFAVYANVSSRSVRAVALQVAVPLHSCPDVEGGPSNAKTCIPGKRCHSSGIGFGARVVRAHIASDFTPE